MKPSARYAKIVEWSDVDNCYVGSAPGLILGGYHGDDEHAVFEELRQIVEETIALYEKDGKPLPPPTSRILTAGGFEEVRVSAKKRAVSAESRPSLIQA